MNPHDLLFTNQYISSNPNLKTLTTPSVEEKNNEYEELKKYLQEESTFYDPITEKEKTFSNDEQNNFDLLEPSINQPGLTNILNRPEFLINEEPLSLSQNVRPIIGHDSPNDGKFRYRKQIISYINIDSRDRDSRKYPSPAKYDIYLNKQYNYIQAIRMASIEYREPPTPINNTNNCVCWITDYTGVDVDSGQSIYKTLLPSAYYTLSDLVQSVSETFDLVTHTANIRYYALGNTANNPVYITGSFPRFRITIDPFTRLIRLIQRLDEFNVTSISSVIGSNTLTITINTGGTPVGVCGDTNFPFIISEDVPIMLAGLNLFVECVGGIPISLIDQVPFFPSSLTGNSYECSSPTASEFVYKLNVYQENGVEALASETVNIDLTTSPTINIPQAGNDLKVTVGRSLLFSFPDECNFSKFLGIQDSSSFSYMHMNINSLGNIENSVPWKVVGNGMLVLDTEDYILMRLKTPFKPIDTISGNLLCARGSAYQDGECDKEKSNEFDFFSKIIFSSVEPGDVTTNFVAADRIFYDAPLVKLTNITVEFYNPSGEMLTTAQEHSFTLQIIEQREILKETLIDSRTGGVNDVGSGLVSTNPL